MAHKLKNFCLSLSLCILTFLASAFPALATSTKEIYRLYNPKTTEHFFTASEKEKNNLYENGWWYEGVGFKAPTEGDPVYRLVNTKTNAHFYTANKAEYESLAKNGWKAEGVVFHSASQDKIPVYRLYNSKLPSTGSHQFLTSKAEVDSLVNQGWKLEGTAWFAEENGSLLSEAQKKEPVNTAPTPAPAPTPTPAPNPNYGGTTDAYVINTNTGKFHHSWCHSVKKMKASNARSVNTTRDTIISWGYVPCKNCNP